MISLSIAYTILGLLRRTSCDVLARAVLPVMLARKKTISLSTYYHSK